MALSVFVWSEITLMVVLAFASMVAPDVKKDGVLFTTVMLRKLFAFDFAQTLSLLGLIGVLAVSGYFFASCTAWTGFPIRDDDTQRRSRRIVKLALGGFLFCVVAWPIGSIWAYSLE